MRSRARSNLKINKVRTVKAGVGENNLVIKNIVQSTLTREVVKKIVDKTIFFANFGAPVSYSIIFVDVKTMRKIAKAHNSKLRHIANVRKRCADGAAGCEH